MLILWAHFWVFKSSQVWRPGGLMFGTIFEIVICAGQFFVILGNTGMLSFDIVR